MSHEPDYLALTFSDIEVLPMLDRREFLKKVGSGIFVFVALGDLVLAQDPDGRRQQFRPQAPDDFNAFLRIAEDGGVTCFLGKTEMGQGVYTSMAQLLAEELDVQLDAIEMVMSDTGRCPWDLGTFGSMSIRYVGPTLRKAGAEARAVLLELGAKELGADASKLETVDGEVRVRDQPSRKVSYGALAKGEQIQRVVAGEVTLKEARDHKVIGRSEIARDAVAKVTGQAIYAGDIRRPGMLYARILRPPAHGARRTSLDTRAAAEMDGVRVIEDGDLVAVLHATPDGAAAALGRVRADFEVPESDLDDQNIFEALLADNARGRGLAKAGDLKVGEEAAAHFFDSTFLDGYVAHAPMETHTAVAEVGAESATIWASTQTPFMVRDAVARVLKMEAPKVRIIAPFVGGGFGGKGRSPQADEAARLAQLAGVPVHVEWTREEEFFYDTFRPAAVVKLRSGVDARGRMTAWEFDVYHAGTRGAGQFYDVPHHATTSYGSGWRGGGGPHPFGVGAWRAPANNTNTFARESQIEMMAAAVKTDPLEFRLRNLKDKRMIAVLTAAAERYGWTAQSPAGSRGRGIACGIDAGTYVAMIAEVDVDKNSGQVQVRRVVCAQDMGLVVNPRGARMQAEGCITMGLGYALSEDVRFNGGRIHERNFDTYILPRFSSVPEIEIDLVDTGVPEANGGGEPAIVTVGGAIGNAIYDAVGARLMQMPMTPARVLDALA